MRKKRVISIFLIVSMMVTILASCGNKIPDNKSIKTKPQLSSSNSESSQLDDDKVASNEKVIKANVVKYVEFNEILQAENGTLTGGAQTSNLRGGYSGSGYVTGLADENDGWEVKSNIKNSQFYNITLTVASDKSTKNILTINGEIAGKFVTIGSEKFETVTFENIFIEKGPIVISVALEDGGIDIDSIGIKASKDISNLKLAIKDSTLINKNADYNTKAIYKYICDNFGNKLIVGQHDSIGRATETNKIFEVTGKYPAIRFGDLMTITDDKSVLSETEIEVASNWAKKGGLVGYMWHWTDPIEKREYYSEKTEFDLSEAVTKEKIATKSLKEIKQLNEDGKISDECVAIIEDIDKVSKSLKELQNDGVTVIWRPLHEASNGRFWWGKDADSYKWLWKLLYQRQTSYHKLNNLIWVWSAQNANWYVGDKYCDILSVDIYEPGKLSKQINSLLFLYKICKTKPIVMSECGSIPTIQSIADEKAMWSYIGQWGGNYLLNEDNSINEDNNSVDNLIEFYNNNLTITREELPDFSKIAERLKEDTNSN